jgi:hypothetical protein
MAQPIKVDNSRPATVRDTAKTLGVSKERTDELVRAVRRMIHRDSTTGEFVIRARKIRKTSGSSSSSNASTKVHKTSSRRAKASR